MFKNKKRAVIFVVIVLILLGLLVKQSIEELTINKFGHFVKGPEFKSQKGIFYHFRTNTAILPDGRIVIFGNYSGGVNNLKYKTEIYDPKTNTLEVIDILPDKDWQYAGVNIGYNILIYTFKYPTKNTSEHELCLYDIQKRKVVKEYGKIPLYPWAVLQNRYIVICNTRYSQEDKIYSNPVTAILILDTKTGEMRKLTEFYKQNSPDWVEPLDDKRVFVYYRFFSSYVVNIKTGDVKNVGNSLYSRVYPVLVKLNNSDILILGGRSGSRSDFHLNCNTTAEIFDSKTLKFKPAGQMTMPRCSLFSSGFSATLMNDGRVLIAGGHNYRNNYIFSFSGPKILKSTEIYDPKTNTFTKSANLKIARVKPHMILLKNGDIFVHNGYALPAENCYRKTTEIFKVNKSM